MAVSMQFGANPFLHGADLLTPRKEKQFFSSIRLGNGVFKTTGDRRLDDLNALVIEQLKRCEMKPREVLDVGASSGITSVEWIDCLSNAGFDAKLVASDVALFGRLVSLSSSHQLLLDRSGTILQHVIFGRPLRPWARRLDTVTGYWLVRRLLNARARAKIAGAESGEQVMLVSSRARNHPRVSFVEDDVLDGVPGELERRFDVIRAANVLNLDYFAETDLRRAVANVKARMSRPNSMLIVARTLQDGSNHGSIFRLKASNDFELLARVGEGSEIEHIVMAPAVRRQAACD
jgi:hypothetical protein